MRVEDAAFDREEAVRESGLRERERADVGDILPEY
jgi:hypothetical protein